MAPAWCWPARSRPAVPLPSGSTRRSAATISTTTPFPGPHPALCRPPRLQRFQGGDGADSRADAALALGTRLNPFSTLPGYGIDYWPKAARLIQVDINADRIGLTKPVAVGIVGDAKAVAEALLARLADAAGDAGRDARKALIAKTKSSWATGTDLDGSRGGRPRHRLERAGAPRGPDWMSLRQAWRAIQAALPKEAIISSDIGNNCAIGNAYPSFEAGRKYLARGSFGPCGYGFPAIVGAKIGNRMCRLWALPATAPSASR